MSYRNPKVYAPDPTAFAKSFMGSFQSTMQGFEAEKEKIRKQQEKDDLIEAEFIKYSNIGDLEGVSENVNNALQDGFNSIVDSKAFVDMSPVERQKILNNIKNLKEGAGSFADLYNIDPGSISNRSVQANPELHSVLSEMKLNPENIKYKFDTEKQDLIISYTDEEGNTNSTSLRDMRKYKNTYVSADDDLKFVNDNMDAFVGDMQKQINDFAKNGTKSRSQILNGMTKNGDLYIDDLSREEKATIWYEMMPSKLKTNGMELYPKGSTLEDRKAQDQMILAYRYKMLDDRLIQPPVKETSNDFEFGQSLKESIATTQYKYNDAIVFAQNTKIYGNSDEIVNILRKANPTRGKDIRTKKEYYENWKSDNEESLINDKGKELSENEKLQKFNDLFPGVQSDSAIYIDGIPVYNDLKDASSLYQLYIDYSISNQKTKDYYASNNPFPELSSPGFPSRGEALTYDGTN